jgi:hypothetical protein
VRVVNGRQRTFLWIGSVVAFGVPVGSLFILANGPTDRLDLAVKLSGVGGLVVGLAGLVFSAAGDAGEP